MQMFPLLIIFTLVMARPFATYDSRNQKGSYVVVKNKLLAKILMDDEGFLTKRKVKKCDRNRLNTVGLSFYISNLLIILIAIVMAAVPEIPCTPYEIDAQKIYFYLDTFNEKIPCFLGMILFCAEFLACSSVMIKFVKEMDEHKWFKILIYVLGIIVVIVCGAFIIELLSELFK